MPHKTRKIRKKRSMRNKKWWGVAPVSNLFVKSDKSITRDQRKIHKANALVLTCMDFRFIDDEDRFLDKIGLNNSYDKFVLAGASLAYSGPEKSYYNDYNKSPNTDSIALITPDNQFFLVLLIFLDLLRLAIILFLQFFALNMVKFLSP